MSMVDEKFLSRLGSRIRFLRQQQNMKQVDLALLCNFEKATMSRIESGKANITILTLGKICQALDVDMKELF